MCSRPAAAAGGVPRSFCGPVSVPPTQRSAEHDGLGSILFSRLLTAHDFASPIDFVDFTVIPAGSTVGLHPHEGNEELYLVVRGEPLVAVEGETRRLRQGDVAVVRSGQHHGLVNDSDHEAAIFVVQVRT